MTRKRIWLQNIAAADVARIGWPKRTDVYTAAALLARGIVGVYGEVER